jgi:hypothetical protein
MWQVSEVDCLIACEACSHEFLVFLVWLGCVGAMPLLSNITPWHARHGAGKCGIVETRDLYVGVRGQVMRRRMKEGHGCVLISEKRRDEDARLDWNCAFGMPRIETRSFSSTSTLHGLHEGLHAAHHQGLPSPSYSSCTRTVGCKAVMVNANSQQAIVAKLRPLLVYHNNAFW